jgi:biopolymer transport protein ExbD
MAIRKSIRHRRIRKKIHKEFDLQLTSMMDILVIVLVFLLKSYATSTNSFSTLPGIHLPVSKSTDVPNNSPHLIVTPEAITFEEHRIVEFVQSAEALNTGGSHSYSFKSEDLTENGMLIKKLYDALVDVRKKGEDLRIKAPTRTEDGKPVPFVGILAIQADKFVKYDTIRKIMYTAGAADFKAVRLLATPQQ